MPPPRFRHGFRNDVFLSYAQADNAPDSDGRAWISQFADDLASRLRMVSGHTIQIWRDDRLGRADLIDATIDAELAASAALVAILSPAYFMSEPCRDEREHFLELSNGALVPGANKSRIVKVAKTRVDRSRYPAELGRMLEHKFYKEEPNGSFKEFHLHERADVRAKYATVLDDVAQELSDVLTALEGQAPPTAPRATVFLGPATGDVDSERNDLRRFLEQTGYAVLPSKKLSLEAEALEKDVSDALQASSLAVFVMGCRYGWVPEMGAGKSFVRLQLEHAAQYAVHVPRIIWIPPGVVGSERVQSEFLEVVRRELPEQGFEIIESNLQALQTHLRDRLRPKTLPTVADEGGPSEVRLYLMVDRCDRDSARPLRQHLLASGVGVDWLPATGEATAIGQLHREWLLRNDAFLIFYGASDETWLAYQQLELRKALGHGRRSAPKTRILLASPPSADKEDLRLSRELVLDGLPPKELKDALGAFISELSPGDVSRGVGRSPKTGP